MVADEPLHLVEDGLQLGLVARQVGDPLRDHLGQLVHRRAQPRIADRRARAEIAPAQPADHAEQRRVPAAELAAEQDRGRGDERQGCRTASFCGGPCGRSAESEDNARG